MNFSPRSLAFLELKFLWYASAVWGISRETILAEVEKMIRRLAIIGAMLICFISTTAAEEKPPRFRFTRGETLTYRVQQITSAIETIPNQKMNKVETTKNLTRLTLEKTWTVAEIDAQGRATLELRLSTMKLERELPNGETDVFDSAKGNDENATELKKLIGPVLAVIQIDDRGSLVEVKESKFGPASRYTADLPFKMVLPDKVVKQDENWKRDYAITLDPPAGTGESYASSQRYTLKPPTNGFVVVGVETTIKDPPAQSSDMIPLLPFLIQGDVYFDGSTGCYYAARMKTERTLTNHLGEGSKYVYVSTYAEDLVPKK